MNKDAYILEEYKHIADAILDIDRRILQVFAVSIAVGVSLLSAVAGLALGGQQDQITVVLAYAALAPDFLVIPAFYLTLSFRIEIMRLGSYRRVFFEERNEIEGWETRLAKFRKLETREANDSVPYTYWAVFLASAILFGYGVIQAQASLPHLFSLAIPFSLLLCANYKWTCVVSKELPRHLSLWRKVSSDNGEAP